jgi:hypothetical protein
MATFHCAQHNRSFDRQTTGSEPWCVDCLDEAQEGRSTNDYINDVLRGFAELNVELAHDSQQANEQKEE